MTASTTNQGSQWTNWGGNQTCKPHAIVRPNNVDEVVAAVRQAITDGHNVRAFGAGHSFSPVALTDGVLLDLQNITGITGYDKDRRRVRALSGTRIHDFGDPLWEAGLALPNQGTIDTQAIGGALATATHGSGIDLQSFSAGLRWVKLINGYGDVVELDETDLRRLRAAQVAVGSMGIFLEVELEVMDAYYLQEEITYPLWPDTERDWDDDIAGFRHYSFIWCPNTPAAALWGHYVPDGMDMTDRSFTKKYQIATPADESHLVTEDGRRLDRSYRIYPGGGVYDIRFCELEYYVPVEMGKAAFTALRDLKMNDFPDEPYPFEVRWTHADDAYLSPFYGQAMTVFSVAGEPGSDYMPYLKAVDHLLDGFQARPHWGKINFFDRERLEQRLPQFGEFCAIRDEFDPNGVFLSEYTRSLFRP